VHDHARFPVSLVISDPVAFAAKRAAMIAAGPSKLQLIFDFDRTVSAFRCRGGELCAASHELLESCVGFNRAQFLPAMEAINVKYFAIEVDPKISDEERAAHMLQWWHQAHALLLQQGIKRQAIDAAVERTRADGRLELRTGAAELLRYLDAQGIPLLVFSAGIRATIESTLRAEGLLLPNQHLIGNAMEFAEDGTLLRFGEDTITSSNKNYSHVLSMEPEFHAKSLSRRQVLLAGDNLGDANMAAGLEGIEGIIKIGLLHDHAAERMEAFKAAFDIVLLNDADCSFIQQLVEDVVNGKDSTVADAVAPAAAAASASAAAVALPLA
jgi:5'-nucleotidase